MQPSTRLLELLDEQNVASELHTLLSTATTSIDAAIYLISPPSSRLDSLHQRILMEMAAAPARGVRCRALLSTPNITRGKITNNAGAHNFLVEHGWTVRQAPAVNLMHSKFWVFDQKVILIGSHNLSTASFTTNHDTSLVVRSNTFSPRLANRFSQLWSYAAPREPRHLAHA